MTLRRMKLFLFVCLSLLGSAANADDVDLFAWANKTTSGSANVLFILDNGANFSASVSDQRCNISSSGVVKTDGTGLAADFTNLDKTAGAVEQCALYTVIKTLTTSASVTLNIGVMGFNANGMKTFTPSPSSTTAPGGTFTSFCDSAGTGACVMMPVTGLTSTVQTNMLSWIRNWAISGNSDYVMKGNNAANGASIQEAWAYFKGKTGVSGKSYSGVAPTGGCGNDYVIFVGNAYRNNSTPGDGTNESSSPLRPLTGISVATDKNASPAATTAEKALVTGTIATSCGTSTLQTDEGKGAYALNWARYAKNQAGIKTYAVGVLGPTCNAEYAAHLTKLGSTEIGGGKYFGTNSYSELVVALSTALTEILSVNSVFSSVSLPASVNQQGEYINQIFIGMFRPDDDFSPRWLGNLKQYQIGYYNGVLKTLDAEGVPLVNSNTGFVTACARSYWTPTAVDSYWDGYDKKGTCTAVASSEYSNYPDGDMVEKGGQAYKLRTITPSTRAIKTCGTSMATCTNATGLTAFDITTVSVSALGVADATAQSAVVNWMQGYNTKNELNKGTTVMRPSAHGDVLHSRPAAVNHGTDDANNAQVVVYYGSNDGLLHAINGNQASNIVSNSTTYAPGQELWSFMPPEFYSGIKRLYDNSPAIKFPDSSVSGATTKTYGMDGPITPLKTLVSTVPKTYIYATMRRGGRAVYAFDVTTPGNPVLKWKSGCATSSLTDTDCTSGMADMGQSWSQIKTFYAGNYNSGNNALVIMGGGYDTCEDYDALSSTGANHNCTATSKGKKVYVLDAVTGAVVKSFDTIAPTGGVARGVVADVAIVNVNGLATYGYVGDLAGNIYRIAFSGADANAWTMTRIASVGCGTVATCPANRKFMFSASVVPVDSNTYNYILIGSGDREKPVTYYTSAKSVPNYFFMIKDKPSDATWLTSESSNCSSTNVICLASLMNATTVTPTDGDLALKKGWYVALPSTEQTVTSASTFAGKTFFSTHQPAGVSADACSTNLGTARSYCVNYANGGGCFASSTADATGRLSTLTAGGLAPSPVIVKVSVSNYDYGTHTYVTGSGAGSSDVTVCVGCASGADNKAGSGGDMVSGTGTSLATGTTEAKTEGSTLDTSSLDDATSTKRYKSRLYWFIDKKSP